jgi:hypothetical protein
MGMFGFPASGDDLWWQELAVLVASSWPEVAVSRESAAALWCFDSFDIGTAVRSVDAIRARSERKASVHRPTRDIEWTTTEEIPFPITTPTETILALAGTRFSDKRWLSVDDRLELAIESGLLHRLVTCADLENMPRQVEVFDDRAKIGRVDFLPEGVVVECDSDRWHNNPVSFKRTANVDHGCLPPDTP